MIKLKFMAGVVLAAMAISSCDEDTVTVGQSLTDPSDQLDFATATFSVMTRTVVADSVLSQNSNCYLGKVKDPETGTDVTSEFSTQLHVLEDMYIAPEDSIIGRYDGHASADSCDIVIFFGSPFMKKDSLMAMKMRVREFDKPVEEGRLYYSNFDPVENKLLRTDANAINQGKVFTFKNLTATETESENKSYATSFRIPLNTKYTTKDGKTYNNYGTYILQKYFENPQNFRNSYTFAHAVCPGFFFQIVDGLGFHAQVSDIGLRVYYTAKNDSIVNYTPVFAGTNEVLQTMKVTNDKDAMTKLANETGHTYLKSPAGLYTEVTIPVDEIKKYMDANGVSHATDSLLSARLVFQRLNNESENDRVLGIPQNILMVEKDSLTSFFEKNKVPDYKTTFYSAYSSSYNTYTFTNISNLVTALWNNKVKGEKSDAQWVEKHPNWNKMLLVPISYTSSSSTNTITNVEHDMSLTSTRLVGGTNGTDSPIQISVVFAKFKH